MSATALMNAILREDAEGVGAALSDRSILEHMDRDGRTALHSAVLVGSEAIVALLIDRGANPNAQDRGGWSPLHFAAQDFHLSIAERLLAAGADVDIIDHNGNTPLWRAVFESRGRSDMIQLFLRHGANRDMRNAHGVSPRELSKTIANFDVAGVFNSSG